MICLPVVGRNLSIINRETLSICMNYMLLVNDMPSLLIPYRSTNTGRYQAVRHEYIRLDSETCQADILCQRLRVVRQTYQVQRETHPYRSIVGHVYCMPHISNQPTKLGPRSFDDKAFLFYGSRFWRGLLSGCECCVEPPSPCHGGSTSTRSHATPKEE